MIDKGQYRADMHRITADRRAAGRPLWDETVDLSDVFHNDDMTFLQIRDEVVRRLMLSNWYRSAEDCSKLRDIVGGLAEVGDEADFDSLWSDLYDLADYDRVWICT